MSNNCNWFLKVQCSVKVLELVEFKGISDFLIGVPHFTRERLKAWEGEMTDRLTCLQSEQSVVWLEVSFCEDTNLPFFRSSFLP